MTLALYLLGSLLPFKDIQHVSVAISDTHSLDPIKRTAFLSLNSYSRAWLRMESTEDCCFYILRALLDFWFELLGFVKGREKVYFLEKSSV